MLELQRDVEALGISTHSKPKGKITVPSHHQSRYWSRTFPFIVQINEEEPFVDFRENGKSYRRDARYKSIHS